ncbi:unnamed protein product [Ostreobium quekettii]|uniref:Uncharacterized protein n=1 Tax=Ostreobium quekettii TaxID=121088 RepID=A0A8S1IQX8_9CHLO|nr:unnamed protein product [Ostreobium quekettii]
MAEGLGTLLLESRYMDLIHGSTSVAAGWHLAIGVCCWDHRMARLLRLSAAVGCTPRHCLGLQLAMAVLRAWRALVIHQCGGDTPGTVTESWLVLRFLGPFSIAVGPSIHHSGLTNSQLTILRTFCVWHSC